MGKYKSLGLVIITLMFILPSFSLVSAAPPVLSTIQSTGLSIAYPQYQYVPIYSTFTLFIHVYNATNYITGTKADCYLDLYNPKGLETMHSRMTAGTVDYSIPILNGNFSTLGEHSFIIQCNSTSQAGFASGIFTVTQTGKELYDNMSFIIFLFVIAYGILLIGIFTRNVPVTMLGGFATMAMGIFSVNSGIGGIRDNLTYIISILTVAIGGFWAVKAGLEQIQESM